MNRYVVVDLETTGHSPKKGDEIIEIGLVVIENREIVDEFSTKIKPNHSIPSFISHLTGIEEKDVQHSPSFYDVIPKLMTYFDEGYFVAHQVQFDYQFLNHMLKVYGYEQLQCPLLDTVELARVLYPRADSFKLEDITQYLGIEHYAPHRALSDAYVTGLLLIEMIQRLESMPYELLTQIQPLTRFLKSDIEQFIEDAIQEKEYTYGKEQTIMQHGFAVRQLSSLVEPSNGDYHSFEEFLDQVFKHSTIKLRNEQLNMSETIYNAFQKGQNTVIEAETGIGKTISYLLPAIYHAVCTGEKTTVSTSTIQLQHQILTRDIALINQNSNLNTHVSILKSPTHYIHLVKLRQFLEHAEDLNYDLALSLAMILVWLTETTTGDKDELQLPTKGEDIWPFISGDELKEDDQRASYFQLALKRAEQASVVIVNHAFLVTEHLLNHKRMPNYQQLIIDEAHRFDEVVRHQLGQQIDYVSIAHALNNLSQLINYEEIDNVKSKADLFFRSIYQAVLFLHSEQDALSDTGKIQLSIDQFQLDVMKAGHIKQELNELILSLEQVVTKLTSSKFESIWKQLLKQNLLFEIEMMLETIRDFFDSIRDEARWINIDQDGAKNAVQLNLEPVQVQYFIKEKILKDEMPTILTSATLRTNHSFQSFMDDLGLPEDTDCVYIPTPYSYQHQARLYVPNDFPDVRTSEPSDYAYQVAEYLLKLNRQLNDKAMVLFTSYEMLRSVYQMMRLMDEKQQHVVLAQGVQSGSREKLKKLYEKSDQAILLGTNSFWEGIDIQSQSVKIIIMVRLPFDAPNHPLFQAKSKYLEHENKNPFYHWMLPQAILKFRQAFGRLIRSETDQGLFFVLDQRILNKSYGKQFLNSIPEVPIIQNHRDQLIEDAKNWLSYKD
ncbi:ATP-dependent DNA helicase DinG [Aquisalibacillus elongatus]|uniref:3'-5' exonuclease DinG n=1 Tax=Aquisalibacillus elongatus TaxID=485577 RepID=A0A3N5C8D9_9BACI|nr:ATP-dependent DNA helicase DinG [Aquisalibacillus elongatus]